MSGRVMENSTSRPVVGALITIGATGRNARSDSAGAFAAVGVAVGVHTVSVRALGFAAFEQRIQFDAGQRLEVDIVLTMLPQALARVDVVTRSVPKFLKDFDARRR
ncbi:carboxypeptidase regulatory-like domain-containing protein, partial [Gemmatimonas sp.]|uniref:carboxypeptidase regulatory-like domain-containing protein n=1 Tax=Gemmatimonas sp. TaxID=1962908 RepID=UPI003567B585